MTTITCNPAIFAAVATAVGYEETRYYLNGVFIEPAPAGGVIMTATDGHRLITAWDESGTIDGESQIVPHTLHTKSDVIKAATVKPAQRPGGRAVMTINSSMVTIEGHNDNGLSPMVMVPAPAGSLFIDGSFPDWRRVLPDAGYREKPAGFKADYLASLGKIAALDSDELARGVTKANRGGGYIHVASNGDRPAWVSMGKGYIRAVIMPVRNVVAPTHQPSWV